MPGFDITGTTPPWVIFAPKDTAEVKQQLSALEARGGRVRHFASLDLMTEQGIHRAFSEAFEFPAHFGRNWDALVDCLDDLCGAVTGRVGVAGVVHDADPLLESGHFPRFVSVLCQGADRANSATDLDGFAMDRPATAEHFIFEFHEFDRERIAVALSQEHPDLLVTTGAGMVGAALDPEEWH